MPLISVIIPLFNKNFSITETLQSVMSQTFTDFEVIIVNDGSTDESVEKVSLFTDKRIQVYHQSNMGAASARNLGIGKATGSLLAFLDGDDIWFENHLEELYRLYTDFPGCGLYCSRYRMKIAKNKTIHISYSNSIPDNYRGVLPDYFDASLKFRVGLTSAVAIPKSVLGETLRFNPDVSSGQDLELFTRIAIEHPAAITNKYTLEYNFALDDQLSKTRITRKKLIDFTQFSQREKDLPSLKRFLDLYRIEYALHFHIFGDDPKMRFYLKDINRSNLALKTKILLFLPPFLLRTLLKLKHVLKKMGINFTIYH